MNFSIKISIIKRNVYEKQFFLLNCQFDKLRVSRQRSENRNIWETAFVSKGVLKEIEKKRKRGRMRKKERRKNMCEEIIFSTKKIVVD